MPAFSRMLLLALACFTGLAASLPASAQVLLSFHSFNGSMLGGRYPHTFIVMEGTLEADGTPVNENYGYASVRVTPAILAGNVYGTIHIESPKYIQITNRHFTLPISDAQYRAIVEEVRSWHDAGKVYNLDTRNCIHFVSRIAQIAGLRAEVPHNLTRRPRAWLNLIGRLNPHLGAREFR